MILCRSVTYMGPDVFNGKQHRTNTYLVAMYRQCIIALSLEYIVISHCSPRILELGNSALTSVSIPTSLVEISSGTFASCDLNAVIIPT